MNLNIDRYTSISSFLVFSNLRLLLDYEWSLRGLKDGSDEYAKAKHLTHLRSANKLQELFFRNGGIYIKLGQHISQLVCISPI